MSGDVTIGFLKRLSYIFGRNDDYAGGTLIAGQEYNDVYIAGGEIQNTDIHDLVDPLPIADGGTGQVTANDALNALLPDQTGNSGKVLKTDGTDTSWSADIDTGITELTGDVTAGPGSGSQAATLATVNANVGSFGSSTSIPSLTVNAKGLVTAASGNAVVAPAGTLTGAILAAGVTASSLTSVGTITSGTWNGGVIDGQYGGTGIANTGKTITLGGNLTTSGAFDTTFTLSNTTTVTLPTTGTLATLAGSETLTNKTLTSPIISTISNTGTLTLPTSTDTLVGRDTTDTLTNKTLTNPTINAGSGTIVLPQASSPSQTAEGSISWDTDDDGITVGNGSSTAFVTVTPWVAYTPTFTGFGTVSNVEIWSRRSGDTLEIRGRFTSGTSTAVEARITLGYNGTNANVTSSATKITSIQYCGQGALNFNAATSAQMLIESNVGYLTMGVQSAGASGLTKVNGNGILASGNVLSFLASVPISGW